MKKEERFKQIIEEYERLLQSICSHYANNHEDRKDLFQEVLINVWKSLDSFRGDSKISTWLYRVAVNTALSSAGKTFRYMKIMVHAEDRHLNVLFEDEKELEAKRKLETNLEELQVQINLLSVIDKAMITLMLEGLSTREIADIIGLTETNVRVKIHRIKEQLKNQFSENKNR
ncbi:MAG: RNA polymerase sigma factor [Prolixibacteraceae bacterium]